MQRVYRVSDHYLGEGSKFKDSDFLTFVSKASTVIGVLRSCKKQFSSFLKIGHQYFFDYFSDNGKFLYFYNGFWTGTSFVSNIDYFSFDCHEVPGLKK